MKWVSGTCPYDPLMMKRVSGTCPYDPLLYISYHRPEVVAGYGEHLFADNLRHATLKGMEGDTGITVAETLLQYIQYATHLKNALPDRRGIEEKDADSGVQLHH